MPDGVEHFPEPSRLEPEPVVILPLMPDGVEHLRDRLEFHLKPFVILPLMPDGVEHEKWMEEADALLQGDPSSDARRR